MNLKCWHIVGTVFTLITGTLLHFTYKWSGKNPLVGSFSAINESTWEHLFPPHIGLFLDPVSGTYGILRHCIRNNL